MALRIKLPAKTLDIDVGQLSEPAQRKAAKRRLTINSEDEGGRSHSSNESPQSARETSKRPRIRRSHTAESNDEFDDTNTDPRSSPPPNSRTSSSVTRKASGLRKKPQPDNSSSTKKKRVVVSEEDEYSDEDIDVSIMEEEEELQAEKIKGNKRASKGKSGKMVGGGTKPSRGKSKQNVVESTSGVKRSRSKLADESMIDVVGDDHDSAPGKPGSPPPPKEVTPPPPAKRRKLPTIKKNKIPGSAGPLTPVTTAKSVLPSQTVTAESTLLPATSARKPAATAGNADFDLRNASVYAELFKTAGGSTPRSGLNRREKDEERRKELNKMRDEARAKRALEEIPAFDLQGQTEKIARFEEKLRNAQSSALYPNFLAAKWREQWEKERRKKRESEWTETGDRNGAKVKSGADERQKT